RQAQADRVRHPAVPRRAGLVRRGRVDQDRLGLGRPHQKLHAQQWLRFRWAADGRLDRQVGKRLRTYVLRRLLVAIPSLLIASFIVFTLPRLIPGDVVQLMLEEKAYGKDLEDLRATLGLNRPVYVQYFEWLGAIVRTNLGESLWTRQPVLSELGRRLPVTVTLGIASAAGIMRLTRAMLLEVLRQDYVRTAWAKGLRERVVVLKHALKNAVIPVVTVLGLQVGGIAGGAVIIEWIFGLPGMGQFL